ncbi:MAG: NAD-dependent epimerase/dehydratase family protein [Sphingobacteriia bacterium]
MKILITGAAGFVGCKIVEYLRTTDKSLELFGIDNLSRRGSEFNVPVLQNSNCIFFKGDISVQAEVESLPKVDWIIDCAAEPSVLAGLNGGTLDLINNNLTGTFYLLEKCKRDNAGFILISTSRVYSIDTINSIPFVNNQHRFEIPSSINLPIGFTSKGVAENFSTNAPISLYGATKLSSELLALEYHYTFGFPVWINRCGVIAGPGQFGKIDQGILSYWVYQYLLNKPLSFIGFGGKGLQVRDVIHPFDIFTIVYQQIQASIGNAPRIINLGGGVENTLSLYELNDFCKKNIQEDKNISSVPDNRKFDIPYYSTDYSLAQSFWNWKPTISSYDILDQILVFGQNNLDHISRIR